MKLLFPPLVALIAMSQAGCLFMRVPERNVPSATSHVGEQRKLEAPLELARYFDRMLIAFGEGTDLDENQPVVERLEIDTPVEIKGVVGRNEPWGYGVFFVCRVMPNGTKFDLPISDAKRIGICDPVLAERASLYDPRTFKR